MLNREILAKTISRKVFYLNGNPNRKPTTNPLSLLMTYHLLGILMDFLAQELQKLEMRFSITKGKNFPQKIRVVSKPVEHSTKEAGGMSVLSVLYHLTGKILFC